MNLYKLTQHCNNGWDTYDSCIVVAATADDARLVKPDGGDWSDEFSCYSSWVKFEQLDHILVTLIGVAATDLVAGTVILASFNAG